MPPGTPVFQNGEKMEPNEGKTYKLSGTAGKSFNS